MDPQLKRGMLEACALAVLARGDSYGYQMVKDVGAHVEVSESTLYPILRRLEAGGYLRVYSREHNGRLRKYYGITEEGRAHLDELRGEWRQVLDVYAFIMEGTEGETMKKEAFLRALESVLEGMSAEERARALEFCAESIDDRVEDGMDEEDAVAALGDVEDVARGLLADRPLGAVVRERVRRESSAGRVILLICASPLLLTLFAVGLSVYAALWAAMVSVYAAVASLLIAGAACALGGVALMFMQGAAPGLCVCGAGLVSFALGLLLIDPVKAAGKGLWKLTKAFGRGCKRLIVGRRKDG